MMSGDSSTPSTATAADRCACSRNRLSPTKADADEGAADRTGPGQPVRVFQVRELAELVHAESIDGRDEMEIVGLNTLEDARPGDLTFIGSNRYASRWGASKADAALVSRGVRVPGHDPTARALIRVQDADLAMATLLAAFAPSSGVVHEPGIDPDATVHPEAQVDPSATVCAGVRVAKGAVIGPGTIIEENAVIGPLVTVGAGCRIRAGVVIRERCIVGNRVTIECNAVIGADGFGYRPDGRGGLVKIPHIGIVVIHDDVEIGACSTVDRAKFGRTEIGPHTKLDNLVQIAHNVRVGRACAFSSQAGIAGSTTVGDYVLLGGQAALADHIRVGNQVKVAACSGVMRDAADGEVMAGIPAMPSRLYWRLQATLHKFADLPKSATRRRGG